jgi:adenosine/AMP kinase
VEITAVRIEKPEATNFILGQSHFIKTVEDLHEAIVTTAPHLRFGIAFCESSGPALVRRSGNDEALVELATRNALTVGAGHSFFIFLEDGFPVSILNTIKSVPEVCRIYCATANPAEIVVAATEQGRAILGVVDGLSPAGVEGPEDVTARTAFLRKIGYKLGS